MADLNIKNEVIQKAIETFVSYGSHKNVKLCKRFFPTRVNQNLEGSIAVMEAMFNLRLQKKILREDIDEYPFKKTKYKDIIFEPKSNKIKKTVLTDSLKILRCNKLIVLKKTNKEGEHGYIINKNIFFKNVRYKLKQASILSDMTRLMISYIKSDATLTADNYFRELDKLIAYILQLPKEHNEYGEMEKNIYKAIANEGFIDIVIQGKKPVSIKPLSVNIDESNKKLIYISENMSINSKKTLEVRFSDIDSISTEDGKIYENTIHMSMFNYQRNFSSDLDTKNKPIEVLLSVNTIAYEYFYNIDMFETMRIITDKREIENTYKEFGVDTNERLYIETNAPKQSANYFLIRATDTIDNITQVIQQNLQYTKVISPYDVQKEVKNRIELFLKNSFDTFPEKPQ